MAETVYSNRRRDQQGSTKMRLKVAVVGLDGPFVEKNG
jgi:hypothetical protein